MQTQAVFKGRDQGLPLVTAPERPGADHGESSGDLLAPGTVEQPGAFDVDPGVDERGGDAFGEVLQGVGGLGAVPGAQIEVVDLVHADQGRGGVQAHPADRLEHVGDVGAAGEWEAEEPGELERDHLRGRGRGHGQIDDRDVTGGVGMPLTVDHLDGLAELHQAGGLPGPGRAGQDQPAPSGVGVPVQVLQPPALQGDLADGRGGDHQQPGVVSQPQVVVGRPVRRRQGVQPVTGQQRRDGRSLGDEGPPPGQRGRLMAAGTTRQATGRAIGCRKGLRGGHQRRSASLNGSKIPNGITFAIPACRCSSSGS